MFSPALLFHHDNDIVSFLGVEDDDEIMGDDGLLGGTTTVDDLKISGNISATNTSIIGGKFTQIIWDRLTMEIDLQFS